MKTKTQVKTDRRSARHKRIRAKVVGTATKPRLAVFKSNVGIYAQLIDDQTGTTLAASDSRKQKGDTPLLRAEAVGNQIAELAKVKKIEEVVQWQPGKEGRALTGTPGGDMRFAYIKYDS